MAKRKTLKELTLKDNFMFGAVMCDERNCKRLLELVLEFPIDRVKVSKEKCIVYHPEYKGIRLDVYAKDEKNTHYNVEMQSVSRAALGKRTRYYHSQIDMDLLTAGKEYAELPNTYIIFICDFDPFGQGKYRYTFNTLCNECPTIRLKDGSNTIFLNTHGNNPEDVPTALIKFLKYVRADLATSTKDFDDAFVDSLQKSVSEIKQSRQMEERYMLTELLMLDERNAGRAEGRTEELKQSIFRFLDELGTIDNNLHSQIMQEDDLDRLRDWLRYAAKSDSIEQFVKEIL